MQGQPHLSKLTEAVARYFDLMFDCDTSKFDQIFRSSAQLHGFRDGQMVVWSAPTYKEVLDKRASPKSLDATRAVWSLIVLIEIWLLIFRATR